MLTPQQYYGGGVDFGTSTNVTLIYPLARVVRGAPTSPATYKLPKIGLINVGGPQWILINRGTAAITLKRDDDVTIGEIPPNKQVYLFCLINGSFANGSGNWRVAGAGNVYVGEQNGGGGPGVGEGPFDFGSAFFPSGLATDMGDAYEPIEPEHGESTNFGDSGYDPGGPGEIEPERLPF